ncbi:MAG TPA: response regulator [Gammaproteobacteria bacterium]|nr:response regulator [Gammaproteobacteria bacterium]
MANNNDYSTLAWVKQEIDETLDHARQSLEEYVENTEDLAQLRFCTTYLHQVAGTLQMVELYGASLIAEEMEQLGMGLLNNEVPQKQDAYELLMRSILQLPDYLEKILTGYKDDPLLVMPLLNDLRASRGEPLLSENALFTPDLTSADNIVVSTRKKVSNLSLMARKLRHAYQVGLLGWYRKQNPQTSLHKLGAVLTELEQICEQRETIRLWWVANGLVEALADQGLDVGVALNKLLGHVDREIKKLIDSGEQGMGESNDLLKNLLYYIARSTSSGGRVNAIKTAFSLEGALPSEEERQVARESISGPNRELMQTVGNAIREELAGVKEVLDLYLRNPEENMTELKEQADILRKTADTLGMLGLGVPRRLVQDQVVAIGHIAEGDAEVNETNLMAIASALLFVESSLVELSEKHQAKPGAEADEAAQKPDEQTAHSLPEVELRQIQEAVLKEVCKELSIAKESIVSFIDSPWDHSLLVSVPHQFNQARGAILVVGLTEPARILQVINNYLVTEILEPRVQPEYEVLDIFADAIASVEYYLESLLERRPNIDFLLNVANESLAKLGYEETREQEPPISGEEDSLEIALSGEQTMRLKQASDAADQTGEFETLDLDVAGEGVGEDLHEFDPDASGMFDLSALGDETGVTPRPPELGQEASGIFDLNEIEQETINAETKPEITDIEQDKLSATQESKAVSLLDDIDEDIIDIFIEEAEEELAVLQELLPQWSEDNDNHEALSRMRRSFHTLKGSGRMVGAQVIGELAWAIENMMNRVLEQTIPMVHEITQLVEEAVLALPGLIECLKGESGSPDVDNTEAIVKRAFDLVDTVKEKARIRLDDLQSYNITDSVTDISRPGKLEEPCEAVDVMDPVLYEIFSNESACHLAVVGDFVETCKQHSGENFINEDLVRALHTLHGSARMAVVDNIAELAGALEKYTKAVMNNETSLPIEGLVVLVQGAEEIRIMLGQINEADKIENDQTELQDRIRTLLSVEIVREEDHLREQQRAALASAEEQPETATVRYDADILDVFLEEGAEILASSEAAVTGWLETPDDLQYLEQLQRDLHTIKGGARMAKVEPVAELSHATESLLTDIVDGECESSPAVMALVQRTLDRLFQMLEDAEANQPVKEAGDLIEQLENTRLGVEDVKEAVVAETISEIEEIAEKEPETKPIQKKATVSTISSLMDHQAQVIPLAKRVEQLEEAPRPPVAQTSGEMIRLPASVLDDLVSNAGEASIYRARLEQQLGSFKFNLEELEQTVSRLRGQLRNMEIETETQILYRYEKEGHYDAEFDPLEMDQYSRMQELAKALVETTSDVSSIQALLDNLVSESETLLVQQARVNTDLQEGLMRTRMVSFKGLVPRMKRIVRQTSDELGKKAELFVIGEHGEMDRSLLERVTAPLEHMLRNALSHGIESPDERSKLGKPEMGNITLTIQREGSDVLVTVADDGQGLDLAALRMKAEERGMLDSGGHITDHDLMQFILESGFSTAQDITSISGRGVGMDVVNSQVKQLGGSLEISSHVGSGTTFVMRLPFTLAVNHALMVDVGEEVYAIPLSSIEGIVRMTRDDLVDYLIKPDSVFNYAGEEYSVMSMNDLLSSGHNPQDESQVGKLFPVLLVRTGDHRTAVQVDGLRGSREVVVKSVGPQISTVRGVSGATILGDGSVVLILDMGALVRAGSVLRTLHIEQDAQPEILSDVQTIMVVDDSITVRKVTTRLLERNGFEVITAKDGVDAIAVLQEHIPDVMLLDIEMPRMDGFELATHMRNEDRLKSIPIIMITSRTGDKHRVRADVIGVDYYMGKPYQEADLLENIEQLVGSR